MAAVLSLSLFVADSLACSCARIPVWMQFSTSDLVFVGKVVAVENGKGGDSLNRNTRFQVETCFKGEKEKEFLIGSSWGTCGIRFAVGERYLVFAHVDAKENRFFTGLCSGTDEVKDSAAEIAFLKFQASKKTGTFIVGDVSRDLVDLRNGAVEGGPLGNVTVVLHDGERKFESRTDANGKFRFEGIPAGNYEVTIDPMPDKTRLEFFTRPYSRDFQKAPRTLVVSGKGGLMLEVRIRRAYGQLLGNLENLPELLPPIPESARK
jgi:hypothetical protein